MSYIVIEKIFDYLFTDAQLLAAGTAYATAFPGCTRDRTGEVKDAVMSLDLTKSPPYPTYVNLFERPYSKDSASARPGIYAGGPGMQTSDRRDGPIASSGYLVEHRAQTIFLVLVTAANDYYTAIATVSQLVFNVEQILLKHVIDTLWYEMNFPGEGSGGPITLHASATGQSGQGEYEGMAVIPIRVRYQFGQASTKA